MTLILAREDLKKIKLDAQLIFTRRTELSDDTTGKQDHSAIFEGTLVDGTTGSQSVCEFALSFRRLNDLVFAIPETIEIAADLIRAEKGLAYKAYEDVPKLSGAHAAAAQRAREQDLSVLGAAGAVYEQNYTQVLEGINVLEGKKAALPVPPAVEGRQDKGTPFKPA